jgi:predicted nucleic acid-binding Zn ribbon protein
MKLNKCFACGVTIPDNEFTCEKRGCREAERNFDKVEKLNIELKKLGVKDEI